MSSPGLPISRLINVSVNLGPQAAQAINLDSLCLLGPTDAINTYERIRSYGGIEAVGVDFSVDDPEYLGAELFFGQVPQPTQLYIGRWAQSATSGELVGGDLTPQQQLLSNFTGIANGAFDVSIDGVAETISAVDFTDAESLSDVAAILTATLEINATLATVVNPGSVAGANTPSYAPGDVITLAGGDEITPAQLTVASTQVIKGLVAAGGSSGTPGTQTVTGTTGTGTKFQASVTVSGGGAITAVLSISLAGNYTVNPTDVTQEPVTGAGLTGAKLKITMGVLTATVSNPGEYNEVPANPVAQAASTGNGVNATFNITWDGTVSAICAWTGTHFTVESNSTGPSSTLSYFTSPITGTDISGLLLLRQGQTAYPPVVGIGGETPAQCMAIMLGLRTKSYAYAFTPAADGDIANADYEACGGLIEAASYPHLFGLSTDEGGAVDPASTSDIGYLLKQLAYNRTISQYSENLYAVSSLFGRQFTVDFNEQNSVITIAYKTEPGVVPELLTDSQADALDGKNYTYYAQFDNDTAIIVNGKMASGIYLDDIQGADWLKTQIQTAVYNLLFTTPTKIPLTDPGVHQIVTTIQSVCDQGVRNGLIGPGSVWLYQGFGQLKTGDTMPNGYYVYAAPVATLSLADRQARRSPPIQVAVVFAGAVQSVNITVNVER